MVAAAVEIVMRRVDPADPRYRVIVTRRFRMNGDLQLVGDLLLLPRLADAVRIIEMKLGRPADRRTELDVELVRLLRRKHD